MKRAFLLTVLAVAVFAPVRFAPFVSANTAQTQPQGPTFERVYPLKAQEGVFAYARIAPDGNTLAYASEMPNPARPGAITQTVTVVDLKTKKVLFEDAGIDAYWSNDGSRMIYSSFSTHTVAIRHHPSGTLTYNVAPQQLGDYYSWATQPDGKDLILTIESNFYNLNGDKAVLPASSVSSCPGIGVGERPMISHDGKLITTFVRGTVVVRGLNDCDHTFDTGLDGAKSDFSFDNRYVAMHKTKTSGKGYDIVVVDLQKHTMRTITTSLAGSSIFPSWTKDGRLSFRYDGDDYRGFMFASNVLSAPEQPMATSNNHLPDRRAWNDVFPETKRPASRYNIVMIWGTWSAHSAIALADLQRANEYFDANMKGELSVATALEPETRRADADHILRQVGFTLPEIPLASARFTRTEARNQIPTTLLFRDGELIDRKLGPLSYEEVKTWVEAATGIKPK